MKHAVRDNATEPDRGRGAIQVTQESKIGHYQSATLESVRATRKGRPGGGIRVPYNLLMRTGNAEILCRLEHQSEKSFYLLTRRMQ